MSLSGSSLHSSAGFFGFPPFPVRGFSAGQSVSHSVVSDSFRLHGLQPARLLCPWDSPGKNTGVGGHALLQGIFPTPGTEPGSPALPADCLSSAPSGKMGCPHFLLQSLLSLWCHIPCKSLNVGEGNSNPLQYSCLENPMDGRAWQATVHGVAGVGYDLPTKPPRRHNTQFHLFGWEVVIFKSYSTRSNHLVFLISETTVLVII